MKSLEEEKEAENRRDTKTRRKEPTRLSEWIDEENRDKNSNRIPENAIALYGLIPIKRLNSNCLSMKPIRAKSPVERHKVPESPEDPDPPDEISETQDPKVEEENDP